VKTLVEEQEVQSSSQAVPQKPVELRAHTQSHVRAEANPPVVAQPKVECYESCLELAALFIARG